MNEHSRYGATPGESEFSHEGLDPPKVLTDWDERLGRYTRVENAPEPGPSGLGGHYRGTRSLGHRNVRRHPVRS